MASKKLEKRTEQFTKRMTELLGSRETQQLLESIQTPGRKSVRYNRRLCGPETLEGEPVPWCLPYGRYWEKDGLPARTLDYATGHYYVQEASAMLAIAAASRVMDFAGKIVLDLTAAPGGKTIQTAEQLQPGYIVANEVVGKRLRALTWNINRHRLDNAIITNLQPRKLAENLPGFFDVIIVDAPCSGEGLFKKGKHSLEKWSPKNVRFCAARQTSILGDAVTLLKPGGSLVYSTCTFAPEENENQVRILLDNGLEPVPIPADLPVSPAISDDDRVCSCSRRVFPHREGGAGAFVSILRKGGAANEANAAEPGRFPMESPGPAANLREEFPHLDPRRAEGHWYQRNGILSLFSYDRVPGFLLEKAVQFGAPVVDRRRPGECFFGALHAAAQEAVLEVGEEEARAYLRGDELSLSSPEGVRFVAYKGRVLGPMLVEGGIGVNKLPVPLRGEYE